MFKIVLHTLIILLVAGLVAGGLYLMVEKSGLNTAGLGFGFEGARGGGELGARPDRQAFAGGQRPADGDFMRGEHGFEGRGTGFSWPGLGGVLIQITKIAVITVLVVAIQSVGRLFRRRRQAVKAIAV